jgi:hypothetical protein
MQNDFMRSESSIKSDCQKAESPELCHLSFDNLEINVEDYSIVAELVAVLEANNDTDLINYINKLNGVINYKDLSEIRAYIGKEINYESCLKSSEFKANSGGGKIDCKPSSALSARSYKYESTSHY